MWHIVNFSSLAFTYSHFHSIFFHISSSIYENMRGDCLIIPKDYILYKNKIFKKKTKKILYGNNILAL